tara:strand:- start:850 stop:1302 length:453 start_codon:yes stop_codon:yes gene_type:complete
MYKFIPLFITAFLFNSCKKDDPRTVKIQFVQCKSFPSVDGNGNPWDAGDGPDTFLRITKNGSVLFQSDVYEDNNTGADIAEISPILTIEDNSKSISIEILDADGSTNQSMGFTTITLNSYTSDGLYEEYPYSIESSSSGYTFEISGLVWE